ncbi:ABC transporter ATP-binding protein [Denitrificimonas sp. JX-1]|uniref:ABC transporter ATP-binding protein n=1 Tax=Denitrificimonas halotolerans TaxID=3098930 RepID=A0ABU5GRH5_9GAMM|nr:ABC transporter ATP-binding protein [Denitrificimonas sp. JX-1]MDY7219593.1 ABC transporter ATP-binding protein [Denitrificimonas sp. JX-1]
MSKSQPLSYSTKQQVVLQLDKLNKIFNQGTPLENHVLHDVSLQVSRGELVALVGTSGSGKSTLLNVMGLLDVSSSGELRIQGHLTEGLTDPQRTQLRSESIGFVFQFHHLISAFSVLDNVLMPLMLRYGQPSKTQVEYAEYLLGEVGLTQYMRQPTNRLSGGQQQRVAIARALVSRPALILADEPTGNLDTQTADEVFELFERFNVEHRCAIVIVTHDPRISARCLRTIRLTDGCIVYDGASADLPSVLKVAP